MIFAIGKETKTTFSLDVENKTVEVKGPNLNSKFTVSPSQFYDINSGNIGSIRGFVESHITFKDTFLPPFITSKNLSHLRYLEIPLWNYALFTDDGYNVFDESAAIYAIELFRKQEYKLTAEPISEGSSMYAISVFCLSTGHDYGFLKVDFDAIYGKTEKRLFYSFRLVSGATIEFSASNIQSAIATLSDEYGEKDEDIVSVEQRDVNDTDNDISQKKDISIALLGGAGVGLTSSLIKELTEKFRGITISSGEKEISNVLPNEIPYLLQRELEKRKNNMQIPFLETVKRESNFPIAGQRRKKGKTRLPIPK
jgi:hypothetical protein